MNAKLVISAIAPNQPGMVHKITELIAQSGASILQCRMSAMAKEFAVIMEVGGEWNAIAKLEHLLPSKAQSLNLITMFKRSETELRDNDTQLCKVSISTPESIGIVNELTQYFTQLGVNIEEMDCRTFSTLESSELEGEIKLFISVPGNISVDNIRQKFEHFCSEKQLKATIVSL